MASVARLSIADTSLLLTEEHALAMSLVDSQRSTPTASDCLLDCQASRLSIIKCLSSSWSSVCFILLFALDERLCQPAINVPPSVFLVSFPLAVPPNSPFPSRFASPFSSSPTCWHRERQAHSAKHTRAKTTATPKRM